MYLEPEITISVAENGGFVIKYQVKNKKNKKDKAEVYPRYIDKVIVASDTDSLFTNLKKIISKMPKGSEEKEFEDAFNE